MRKLSFFLLIVLIYSYGCNSPISVNGQPDTNRQAHSGSSCDSITHIMRVMYNELRTAKTSVDIDITYATLMLTQRKATIDVAKREAAQGVDNTLKLSASRMVGRMQDELQVFESFLKQEKHGFSSRVLQHEMAEAAENNSNVGVDSLSNNLDNCFAKAMVQLHMQSTAISEIYLKKDQKSELNATAYEIIQVQKVEMELLKSSNGIHNAH